MFLVFVFYKFIIFLAIVFNYIKLYFFSYTNIQSYEITIILRSKSHFYNIYNTSQK